ncbi:hypothetical protein QQ045_004503 [Rhodiola kirilowii]
MVEKPFILKSKPTVATLFGLSRPSMASTYRDRTTEFRRLSDCLKEIGVPIDAAFDRDHTVPTTTQPTTSYRSEFNKKASRIGLGIHETSLKISKLSKLFHVTDQNGNNLTDESVISYIEQSLRDAQFVRSKGFDGLTLLELTGTDKVRLTMAELHHSSMDELNEKATWPMADSEEEFFVQV